MSQCEQQNEKGPPDIQWIYARYDGFIRRVIHTAVRQSDDREDIYQEVFVALSQKGDFDGIDNMEGYLYRVVINKANGWTRKNIAAETGFDKYCKRQGPVLEHESVCDRPATLQDDYQEMLGLIQRYLSKKESQALLLRFRDHYTDEQAARKMNVQKETLIHYVSVGLKKIRDIAKSRQGPE